MKEPRGEQKGRVSIGGAVTLATSRPLESAHVGGVGHVGDDNVYYCSGERLKLEGRKFRGEARATHLTARHEIYFV